MKVNQAAVLLSGGMDSVAALHWASDRYPDLLAVLYDYGQRNRDAELTVAAREARSLGVPVFQEKLTGMVLAGILGASIPAHREHGVSPAFVVGRNLILIAYACAHSAKHFPNGNIDLIVGFNQDDRVAFPDCEGGFLVKTEAAVQHGMARHIQLVAPWLASTKAAIIAQAAPEARNAIARSWSCYDGAGPCGKCTACVLRAKAFTEAGLKDECCRPVMTGGDPSRMSA